MFRFTNRELLLAPRKLRTPPPATLGRPCDPIMRCIERILSGHNISYLSRLEAILGVESSNWLVANGVVPMTCNYFEENREISGFLQVRTGRFGRCWGLAAGVQVK
jgi:hypothetical protein